MRRLKAVESGKAYIIFPPTLVAKRYGLDIVKIFTSVMAICGIDDERPLKAAIYIRDYGLGVFDAFHAANCGGKIISSDSVYDRAGVERVRLEEM